MNQLQNGLRTQYTGQKTFKQNGDVKTSPLQTVDKVSKEALFFVAKSVVIWYNKYKQNKKK